MANAKTRLKTPEELGQDDARSANMKEGIRAGQVIATGFTSLVVAVILLLVNSIRDSSKEMSVLVNELKSEVSALKTIVAVGDKERGYVLEKIKDLDAKVTSYKESTDRAVADLNREITALRIGLNGQAQSQRNP